jgi:translation initiation factor 2 subunit 2
MVKPSYEDMLKRVYSKLPSKAFKHKRFELPKPRSWIAGSRTILLNYKEVCDTLNRDPNAVLKFLSRELATAGHFEGARAFFQGRFHNSTFQRLVKKYADVFVVCPICDRPDTKVVKEKRLSFLVCEACGARSSIRPV